jgi:hypothetical protein
MSVGWIWLAGHGQIVSFYVRYNNTHFCEKEPHPSDVLFKIFGDYSGKFGEETSLFCIRYCHHAESCGKKASF